MPEDNPYPNPVKPKLDLKSIDFRDGYVAALQFAAGMIAADIAMRESGEHLQGRDPSGVSALIFVQEDIDEALREITGFDPKTGEPLSKGDSIQ